MTSKQWYRIRLEYKSLFSICCVPGCFGTEMLSGHHIIPYPIGPDHVDNLIILCGWCHAQRIIHSHWKDWALTLFYWKWKVEGKWTPKNARFARRLSWFVGEIKSSASPLAAFDFTDCSFTMKSPQLLVGLRYNWSELEVYSLKSSPPKSRTAKRKMPRMVIQDLISITSDKIDLAIPREEYEAILTNNLHRSKQVEPPVSQAPSHPIR